MCDKTLGEFHLDGKMLSAEDLEQDLKILILLESSDTWCTAEQWDIDNQYSTDVNEITMLKEKIKTAKDSTSSKENSPVVENGINDIAFDKDFDVNKRKRLVNEKDTENNENGYILNGIHNKIE